MGFEAGKQALRSEPVPSEQGPAPTERALIADTARSDH